jgi:hypothetical protein
MRITKSLKESESFDEKEAKRLSLID